MLRIPRNALPRVVPILAALTLSAWTCGPLRAASGTEQSVGPRLGLMLDSSSALGLPRVEEGDAAPLVRVEARWDRIERIAGAYDWTEVSPAVDSLHKAGYEVVLALTGSNPLYLADGAAPSPLVPGAMPAWLGFVRGAVRNFAERVSVFEVGDHRARVSERDADIRALVIKQSALAVRAEAEPREVLVAQSAVRADDLPWQVKLWQRDVAAYVDILPVAVDAARELPRLAADIQSFFRERLMHPPASALWVQASGGSDWDAAATAIAALNAGASVALFSPPATDDRGEQLSWARGVHDALAPGYAPASGGAARIEYDGPSPGGARVLGRFLNDTDFTTIVLYQAPPPADGGTEARLIVSSSNVRNVRAWDPLTGPGRRIRNEALPAGAGPGRALFVPTASHPTAAIFERPRVSPGFELDTEELQVASSRGLTAEEIIARFQRLQQDQEDRLERWTARGRIEFHFKLAQGGATVDVAIDSTYFWERGGQLEWEQTNYYINGNKVGWKNIPELPLIQPEKVVTLPLDLTLDKTYAYRLAGEEKVDGREAYLIDFQPAVDSPQSLYRGRLWIDKTSFARLRARIVQTNLEPPVLSSEEVDRFTEYAGPDGRNYWMFSDIDGQQIWNIGGRTFVVRREVKFDSFEINPPRTRFEQEREQAYASEHQMLRDTEGGFRYLERQDDGSRTVKEGEDLSQFFAAAGALKDNSQDNVVPLAGVNYFNFDLWGKKIQFNALFAGVIGFVTASKPNLAGGRFDLTLDAALSALKNDDKVFFGDDEVLGERVERRSQSVTLRLGVPAGSFFKVSAFGRLAQRQYFTDDDAVFELDRLSSLPMIPIVNLAFVLPEDHLESSAGVQVEFNRRGYTFSAEARRANRSDWKPWGLFDANSGMFGTIQGGMFVPGPAEPLFDTFTTWGATGFKEWYLPKFQKIRGTINYLNGSDLDRFSRYQFSLFGDDRLNGFSGSGVRFDEALIARLGYSFNLFEVIRLDAALEGARVDQENSTTGSQSFSGIGLSGNFVGPWKTVININYGYALTSDIADLEGEQEFLLLVLKLF